MRPVALVIAAIALASGCSDRVAFDVVATAPAAGAPLRLDEPIEVAFDAAVDPSSVHAGSVAVLRDDGTPAPGRLETIDAVVRFVPRPVASQDLADGGYPPGGTIRVALPGFPGREGVLSAAGTPLSAARSFAFAVVSADGAPFADRWPTRRAELLGAAHADALPLRPDGRLVLAFSKPLDPRSVRPEHVLLLFDNPDRDRVPVAVALRQYEERADVEVRPAAGFGSPGTRYILDLSALEFRDLSGRSVLLGAASPLVRLISDPHGAEIAGTPVPARGE